MNEIENIYLRLFEVVFAWPSLGLKIKEQQNAKIVVKPKKKKHTKSKRI